LVCKPREFGGLGIINPKLFNLTLLGKWIWRLGSDKGGLWKEILVSKYGGWRSLGDEGKSKRYSLWWKDLKEVWALEGWGRSFEDGFKWKVGDGKDISFWKDSWLNGVALKSVFSRLYSICSAKDAKVAELEFWSNGVWGWQLAWRRLFFNWENPLVDQLSHLLLEAMLASGEADRWIWKVRGLQTFSVNSAYNLVRKDREVVSSSVFRKLWRCKAVPSAVLTAWRTMENKLATRVNLNRRGVLVESSMCCLCEKEEESCRNLFLDCSFAW